MEYALMKRSEWIKTSRMKTFLSVFGKKYVFTPVLHVDNLEQVLENLKICFSNNVDGVWLIAHNFRKMNYVALLKVISEVRKKYPSGKYWIGVNFLDMHAWDSFRKINEFGVSVDGIWADNSYIDDSREEQKTAKGIQMEIFKNNFKGLYMAGIAFKYLRQPNNLGVAARLAAKYMDVVITSGPGTGKEIGVDKTKIIRENIGEDVPLGVASGVNEDNIDKIKDYVNIYLVASSICRDFHNFDEQKLRRLCEKVHSFNVDEDDEK